MKESKCGCGGLINQKNIGRPKKYCSNICRDKYSRAKISYTCKNCGKIFYRRKRTTRETYYCSYKCSVDFRTYTKKDMKKHVCRLCDEEFYRLPGNSNPNIFCSKRCQLIYVSSKSRPFTEEVFESLLIDYNIYYKIQYNYHKYFSDFYFPHLNLLFELDGKTFHSGNNNLERDSLKCSIANDLGYNMIRVWCSRSNDVEKLKETVVKLSGDDLADIISAIPNGMINSVNLVKGCDTNSIANDENHTIGNVVPSLEGNLFEGVETKVESKDNNIIYDYKLPK